VARIIRRDVVAVRQFQQSTETKEKRKAQQILKQKEGAIADGRPVAPRADKLTFDAAVEDVKNDYRLNGRKSLDNLKRRITLHLMKFFGGRKMVEITTSDCRAYASERLNAGASAASVNRELAIVKRAVSLAVKGGTLFAHPHIEMLRENNVRQGFFEVGQFTTLRSHLPEPLQPVITFAYFTGWRIPSEVLPLKWHQWTESRRSSLSTWAQRRTRRAARSRTRGSRNS
jgi:hypothetical protein